MKLFDLHCDTLGLGYYHHEGIAFNSGCVSLAQGQELDQWFQTFAAFIPDGAEQPEWDCFGLLDTALRWEKEEPERFRLLHDRRLLETPFAGCTALLSVENGGMLANTTDPIGRLAARGVRMLSLTWNGDNGWASGCLGDSSRGLTPAGREALSRMEETGILPDVSHLNERGFWQVMSLTKQPVLATHSNAAAVCPHPRNLTDDQFRAIAERGGLVGLNLYAPHLGGDGAEAFARHLEHFWALGGEDTLCIGADLDGMPRPFTGGLSGMPGLYESLRRWGYDQPLLDGLFYENARRFFAARLTEIL